MSNRECCEAAAAALMLALGLMAGFCAGLTFGQSESYASGVDDGIQYADDTAREGSNCGVRPPFPKDQTP